MIPRTLWHKPGAVSTKAEINVFSVACIGCDFEGVCGIMRSAIKSDEKGNVDYDISNLSVSGVAVDGGLVKPYLSSLELFSNLSQIPFSSLSFATDRLSFAEGVPQTLIG